MRSSQSLTAGLEKLRQNTSRILNLIRDAIDDSRNAIVATSHANLIANFTIRKIRQQNPATVAGQFLPCYGEYPEGAVSVPTEPQEGSGRVLRGGSLTDGKAFCRSAIRYTCGPARRASVNGFRVALSSPDIPK